MHVCIFDLEQVKVIWGHSVHFSKNRAVTQKRLVVDKTDGNLGLWDAYNMSVGIFDLEDVKVSWGHSVHFSENRAVTQKQLVVERNGGKFVPRGCILYACWSF